MWLQVVSPQGRNQGGSPAKFAYWRAQDDVLQHVSAFRGGRINDTGGDVPEQLRWAQVSADYFRLFGAAIVEGRAFTAEEDLPNGPKVALVGERLWERRFDRDPEIVGRSLSLSGEPHVVVGVVGEGFDFSDFGAARRLDPVPARPNATDQGHYFTVAGRLRPGVSLAQAQAALAQATGAYRERFPEVFPDGEAAFGAEPIREMLVRTPGPCCWCSSAPSASCCSSPAPTSPTCCSCGRSAGSGRSRSAPPSGPGAGASSGNC